MRKFSIFFLLCFAPVLVSCSKKEPKERIKITQPSPEKGKSAETWDIRHDTWASDADRDLVREIREALVEDSETVPFAEAVAIEANNGSIVLRGSGAYTLTFEEWQTVGRRVRSVKGVKSVEVKSRVAPTEWGSVGRRQTADGRRQGQSAEGKEIVTRLFMANSVPIDSRMAAPELRGSLCGLEINHCTLLEVCPLKKRWTKFNVFNNS